MLDRRAAWSSASAASATAEGVGPATFGAAAVRSQCHARFSRAADEAVSEHASPAPPPCTTSSASTSTAAIPTPSWMMSETSPATKAHSTAIAAERTSFLPFGCSSTHARTRTAVVASSVLLPTCHTSHTIAACDSSTSTARCPTEAGLTTATPPTVTAPRLTRAVEDGPWCMWRGEGRDGGKRGLVWCDV